MIYLGLLRNGDSIRFHFTTNDGAGGKVGFSAALETTDIKVKIHYRTGAFITENITAILNDNPATGSHEVQWTATKLKDNAYVEFLLDPDTETVDGESVSAVIATGLGAARRNSPNDNYIILQTPTTFNERSGVTSGTITRSGFPDYGAIFTGDGTPTVDDFDINLLQGAILRNKDAEANDARGDYFMILGGYFFNDTGDKTTKVFGIAKDIRFNIQENGTTIINNLWTGTALTEATDGNGWTFIVGPVLAGDTAFPTSGDALEIFIDPATMRKPEVTVTEINDTNLNAIFNLGVTEFTLSAEAGVTAATKSQFTIDTSFDETERIRNLGQKLLITAKENGAGNPELPVSLAQWRTIIKITEDTGPAENQVRFHLDKPLTFVPSNTVSNVHKGIIWINDLLPSMMFNPTTTIFVDGTNGVDGYDGRTEETPVKTNAAAKLIATDGSTIVYIKEASDTVAVDFTQNFLTFIAREGLTPAGDLQVSGKNPTFKEIHWSGAKDIILTSVDHVKFIDCDISNAVQLAAAVVNCTQVRSNIVYQNSSGELHADGTLKLLDGSKASGLFPEVEFNEVECHNSDYSFTNLDATDSVTIRGWNSKIILPNTASGGDRVADGYLHGCEIIGSNPDVYNTTLINCKIAGAVSFFGSSRMVGGSCEGAVIVDGTNIALKAFTCPSLQLKANAENGRFEGLDIDGTLLIDVGAGATLRNQFSNNAYKTLTNSETTKGDNVFDFDNRKWDEGRRKGADIWVDPLTGVDTGTAGADSPLKLVAAAITKSVAGDEIHLRGTANIVENGLTLPRGVNLIGHGPVFWGKSATGPLITFSGNQIIKNIVFENLDVTTGTDIAFAVSSMDIQLINIQSSMLDNGPQDIGNADGTSKRIFMDDCFFLKKTVIQAADSKAIDCVFQETIQFDAFSDRSTITHSIAHKDVIVDSGAANINITNNSIQKEIVDNGTDTFQRNNRRDDSLHNGVLTAASATTATLDSLASLLLDFFKNDTIEIIHGTGRDQVRTITAYTVTTQIATVSPAWVTTPDTTSVFVIRRGIMQAAAGGLTKQDVADAHVDQTFTPTGNVAGSLYHTQTSKAGTSGFNRTTDSLEALGEAVTTIQNAISEIDVVDTMMFDPLESNVELHLQLVDQAGAGVTGENPLVSIKRLSDGQFYDSGLPGFAAGFNTEAMAATDATNDPGAYRFSWDYATVFPNDDPRTAVFYLVKMNNTGGDALTYTRYLLLIPDIAGSYSKALEEGNNSLIKSGSVWSLIVERKGGSTVILSKILNDKDDLNISDPATGEIAKSLDDTSI